jgi:hypothetical protein
MEYVAISGAPEDIPPSVQDKAFRSVIVVPLFYDDLLWSSDDIERRSS